jgi:uncharacterized protein YjiK
LIQRTYARDDAREDAVAPRAFMRIAASVLVVSGAFCILFAVRAAASPNEALSASGAAVVRQVQVLDVERTGVTSPAGLAFSAAGDAFYVVEANPGKASTDVVVLEPFELRPFTDRVGAARIAAAVKDPVNVTFDARHSRLLLLDNADRLLEVRASADGTLDPRTLVRHDGLHLDIRDPQGMAVDPTSGVVFVLDAGASRILRIEPGADGSFDAVTVSTVDPRSVGTSGARGLAFDASTGHLHLRHGQALHELTSAGEVVATRDLSGIGLASSEGMVFAPSGDQTDPAGETSVYMADSGGDRTSGRIVELSLAPLAVTTTSFTSSLVSTVDLGALAPPSSDPSGITYLTASDSLMVSDGEIEETVNGIEHFEGANVWELTRSGAVLRTANVSSVPPTSVPMTNEPAGVAFNPSNGHYYFSADDGKKIFDLNPGPDGLVGTAGDTWTSFSTIAEGNDNGDPEGITYNTFNGRLYVADGVNREIYEYETSGTLVGHFDVLGFGVNDPESVEFNPVSGTLFVLSQDSLVVETTTTGTLLASIDVSAAGGLKHAGLAYAPATTGPPGARSFYVVDRGIDNNVDPDAVDGKLFELTAPDPIPPENTPPVASAGPDQEVALPSSASLDGDVDDDGDPDPPGAVTTTWSQVGGPSTVTFGNAAAVDTIASATVPGTYVVRLSAHDGEFTSFDDVNLTFTGSGGVQSIDVRVNANADDAEEVAVTGLVQRGDGDLDLMTDNSDTKLVVGTRFGSVAIPPGASITNAHVQFQADESHSVATTLTIRAQAADNPPAFTTANFDLSSRSTTTASATWSPDPWVAGASGLAQRSTDLAGVVQEIVNRPGWASGNALVLLVRGSGRRVAVSYNQIASAAPLLHIEWSTGTGNSPPMITSNGGGATASVSPAENQTFVTDVEATDPDLDTLTYSISGGADATAFTIDPATGVLVFAIAPDSEVPTDAGGNNVYDVVVSVSDDDGALDAQAISATVHNVNEFSPVITSDGGGPGAALTRPDGQTQVTDVNATDGDNQPLTYSISGGDDQSAFTIDPVAGLLAFVSAPDFDAPTDVGSDNVYEVLVSASDDSLSDVQAIAVTVTENAGSPLYFSLVDVATVGGVTAENEDVLYFDGTSFGLAFDGSDVGLANFRIDAFSWLSTTSLLLSFDASDTVPGVPGTVDDSDLVRFTATSLGTDTAGAFSLYFDGSDVGLTVAGEDVDAVEFLPNGHLLLSTINTVAVTGVAGEDEDLLEFTPTSIGPSTSGTFSLYFDGSDMELTAAGEDIDAAAVDALGRIYLSTFNGFSVPGISGQDDDVFVFTPATLGTTTAGTFSPTPYFDGSAFGLAANDVFAIDLP